jgi:pimeloyl-ACP methyl ester carboxylesterase
VAVGRFRSGSGRARFRAAYEAAMAELPEPDRTADVPTSSGTVRAYRFGPACAGPPLVLLPGMGASTPMWAGAVDGLRRIRPVVALDLLGQPGLSVQTRALRGPADHARWLGEALDGCGVGRAHLLGVSFGGWCAVNLAHHAPDRVASLLLLDPAHTFGRIGPRAVLFALVATVPGTPQRLRDRGLRWIGGGADPGDSATGRMIAVAMREYRSAPPAWRYPTDDQLRAITAPALVVIAGRSVIHRPARAAARARLLPRARVELWPDASHALSGEFPQRVVERAAALAGA